MIVQRVAEGGRCNKFPLSAARRCIRLRSQCFNFGIIMKNSNSNLVQIFTYELLLPYGSD